MWAKYTVDKQDYVKRHTAFLIIIKHIIHVKIVSEKYCIYI